MSYESCVAAIEARASRNAEYFERLEDSLSHPDEEIRVWVKTVHSMRRRFLTLEEATVLLITLPPQRRHSHLSNNVAQMRESISTASQSLLKLL